MNKVSVNISTSASGRRLKEDLTRAAHNRGVNLSKLVAAIYRFAVNHREKFEKPLKDSREKPGGHISASVPASVRDELTDWAVHADKTRTNLCCFILEKVLEDDLLDEVFKETSKHVRRNQDPDDPDDE